jgi:parvulin-like peptidyl-prolyl isomerase
MDLKEYRQIVVRTRVFVRKSILGEVTPSETALRQFLARNRSDYRLPDRVLTSHLLLQPPQGGDAQVRQILSDMRARIVSGKISYEDAVARWSQDEQTREDGGVLGWVPRPAPNSKPDPLAEAVWKLKDGELSQPIRSVAGLHLVKRVRFLPARDPSFEELRETLVRDYQVRKLQDEADAWLKDLVRQAAVERYPDRVIPAMRQWARGKGRPLDEVAAARVDGRAMTVADLLDELQRQHGAETAETLIFREVLEQSMATSGIEVTDEEIAEAIEEDREAVEFAAPGVRTNRTLEDEIADRYGMGIKAYGQSLVRARLFVSKVIRQRVRPDEIELRLWFASHAARYRIPERVEVMQLVIKPGPDDDVAALRRQMEQWRESVMAGERTLEAVAAEAGVALQNARLPRRVTGYGELRGTLPEAAWKLEDGELSEILETSAGLHLLQRRRLLPEEDPRFESIYERVYRDFMSERVRLEADMMVKDLVNAAGITRNVGPALAAFRAGRSGGAARNPGNASPPSAPVEEDYSGFGGFD